jgi:hypothetical protein
MIASKLGARGATLETLERGAYKNPLTQPVLFSDRKFFTSSGKVNLVREAPPPPAAAPAEFPMFLLALSTPESQCSQWAVPAPLPLPLTVHPSAAPGFADGALCRIESPLGQLQVRLVFDPKQRPDIALLPKGGTRAAAACANGLIHARLTDLGDGAALYEECIRILPHA